MRLTVFAATLAFLLWGTPAFAGTAPDDDGDGISNGLDNCSADPNPFQDDTDSDDCGNICDTDYNQNGATTFADFGQFSANYGSTNHPLQQHVEAISAASVVGFADFGVFSASYGSGPPGPSGTTSGTTACP